MTMKHLHTDINDTYEPVNFASVKSLLKTGMLTYDIGAYDGITSVIVAAKVGGENVVIIEPGEMNWATIQAYWVGNNLRSPRATYAGFVNDSDKPGVDPRALVCLRSFPPEASRFPVRSTEEGLNFRVLEYRNKYQEVAALPWLSLDTIALIAGPPDAIVMDVEGAELLVLRGAIKTLQMYSPLIWVSIHPHHMREHFKQDPQDLHEFMSALGYGGILITSDHEEHWLFQKKVS